MSAFLVCGVGGSGKSSLAKYLVEIGFRSIDTDDVPGLCHWEDNLGAIVPYQSKPSQEWLKNNHWRWDRDKLIQLIESSEKPTYFCGGTSHQQDYFDLFEKIFVLDIPVDIMIQRVESRTDNSFGKSVDEQATLRELQAKLIAKLTGFGAIPIDAGRPIDIVARDILKQSNVTLN